MDGEVRDGKMEKVCSLCGDIGFPEALVLCPRCGYRLQHTYCSRNYPNKIDMERWGCEWCLHQEDQEERKKKASGSHVNGQIHKKSSSKALDRWKKLAKATKLGNCRRYKLLADVLC